MKGQPPVVMVVDDDENMRTLLGDVLKERGCKVKAFEGIAKSREWLAANVPAGLFCDVMMPDGNGFELCRWARSQARLKKVPIVMMTAIGDDETARDAVEIGIIDYLHKPFPLQDLNGKIDKILASAS